jgi:F-type H+-transporting ATPase subunit b
MNVLRFLFLAALAAAFAVTASAARAQDGKEEKAEPAKAEATVEAPHDTAAQPTAPAPPAGTAVEHEPDRNPMEFDPDLAIFSAGIFLLLLAILGKFAWPQIAAALDEREKKVADNIAAAALKLEEAKRIVAEHEAKLAAAAGEVRALLEEARRDADHTRKAIEAQGHQAAQDELARAIREIGRAKDGAIEDLAKSSANVAVEMARRVIQQKITPDEQSALVRTALDRLAAVASKN